VFGHRQRDARDVDFLKGIGAEHLARYVAGDADHWNRIEHSGGNSGYKIRRAGAAGSNRNADLARGARIAVGHVCSALLMAHQRVMDGKFAQCVVHGRIAPPG